MRNLKWGVGQSLASETPGYILSANAPAPHKPVRPFLGQLRFPFTEMAELCSSRALAAGLREPFLTNNEVKAPTYTSPHETAVGAAFGQGDEESVIQPAGKSLLGQKACL